VLLAERYLGPALALETEKRRKRGPTRAEKPMPNDMESGEMIPIELLDLNEASFAAGILGSMSVFGWKKC